MQSTPPEIAKFYIMSELQAERVFLAEANRRSAFLAECAAMQLSAQGHSCIVGDYAQLQKDIDRGTCTLAQVEKLLTLLAKHCQLAVNQYRFENLRPRCDAN